MLHPFVDSWFCCYPADNSATMFEFIRPRSPPPAPLLVPLKCCCPTSPPFLRPPLPSAQYLLTLGFAFFQAFTFADKAGRALSVSSRAPALPLDDLEADLLDLRPFHGRSTENVSLATTAAVDNPNVGLPTPSPLVSATAVTDGEFHFLVLPLPSFRSQPVTQYQSINTRRISGTGKKDR